MVLLALTRSHLTLWAFLLGIMGGSVVVDMILMKSTRGISVPSMLRPTVFPPVAGRDLSHGADINKMPRAGPRGKAEEDLLQDETSLFRKLLVSPEVHNTTVSGKPLPGTFFYQRLFLLGARLTTSFEEDDQSVHVDLFGFPGDWFTRKGREVDVETMCPTKDPTEGRLLKYQELAANTTMYCQLECDVSEKCGKKVPMELVPLVSMDPNQGETTLIWRCNVSHLVKKDEFVEASKRSNDRALRVSFSIRHYDRDAPGSEATDPQTHSVTEVDIPLHTAAVGHAGPQIVGKAESYFTQPKFKVGLMTAIFGMRGQKYLPEFVQHHLNTGFQQIVVGVEATLDSPELNLAQETLAPFLEQGTVLLAATGHQKYFECDSDFPKLHFYHQTLYHFKGLAPYSATWDIDEYWVPPGQPGETPRPHLSTDRKSSESFLPIVTNDKLWQESNYAKAASIGSIIDEIDQYYQEDDACGNDWCFHLLSSYTVHLLDGKDPYGMDESRMHRQVFDFGRRDEIPNRTWQKAISNTKIAHMSGMHVPGSCKFEGKGKQYFEFSDRDVCQPRAEGPERFGRIHHFFNLMVSRGYPLKDKMGIQPPDEYVSQYGDRVVEQLNALYNAKGSVTGASLTAGAS